MKQTLAMLFVTALLLFSLAGCGEKKDSNTANGPSTGTTDNGAADSGWSVYGLEDGVPVLRYELVYNAQGECGEAQPWYYLTPFNDMLSEANSVPEQFAQELIAALQELRVQLALTAFE